MSQYSLAARHLKEAWWRETDAETFTRIIKSSINTYADKAEAMYKEMDKFKDLPPEGLRKHAMENGDKYVKGQIKSMHPLSGIAGELKVEWEGKKYNLKPPSGSKSPDAFLFWSKLKDYEKRNVFNAVKDYVDIVKELKLGGLYR